MGNDPTLSTAILPLVREGDFPIARVQALHFEEGEDWDFEYQRHAPQKEKVAAGPQQ